MCYTVTRWKQTNSPKCNLHRYTSIVKHNSCIVQHENYGGPKGQKGLITGGLILFRDRGLDLIVFLQSTTVYFNEQSWTTTALLLIKANTLFLPITLCTFEITTGMHRRTTCGRILYQPYFPPLACNVLTVLGQILAPRGTFTPMLTWQISHQHVSLACLTLNSNKAFLFCHAKRRELSSRKLFGHKNRPRGNDFQAI